MTAVPFRLALLFSSLLLRWKDVQLNWIRVFDDTTPHPHYDAESPILYVTPSIASYRIAVNRTVSGM